MLMKRRDGSAAPDDITLPAKRESIQELVEFLAHQAWEGGFNDTKIEALRQGTIEVIENILRFSCADGEGEITITCEFVDAPALLVNIIDTGKRFNMLLAGSPFPESADFVEDGPPPSLKAIKKAVRNIEYRRDAKQSRNILALVIPSE
ncbi:MAG TPA: hypothetical protein VGJ94_09450 [Syntrophorhabdaceae bacterium]